MKLAVEAESNRVGVLEPHLPPLHHEERDKCEAKARILTKARLRYQMRAELMQERSD